MLGYSVKMRDACRDDYAKLQLYHPNPLLIIVWIFTSYLLIICVMLTAGGCDER